MGFRQEGMSLALHYLLSSDPCQVALPGFLDKTGTSQKLLEKSRNGPTTFRIASYCVPPAGAPG